MGWIQCVCICVRLIQLVLPQPHLSPPSPAEDFRYLRLDGTTPVARRLPKLDEFNNNPDIHVMLLTTRAGGIGVNLIGADRVLLFDPDWNPNVDSQAKERA